MYRLLLLAIPLLAAACRGPAIPDELPLTPLAQGQYSQQSEQRFEWITEPEAFAAVWRMLRSEPPPAIDFERDGVIALFMGEQPTGGYAIRVESVARSDQEMRVDIALQTPGPECMTTQALTQPYQLVRVPQAAPRLVFTTRTITVPCR